MVRPLHVLVLPAALAALALACDGPGAGAPGVVPDAASDAATGASDGLALPLADVPASSPDEGGPLPDTAVPPADTAVPPADTAVPPADTAAPPADTAVPPADTAVPPADTAVPPADTATPPDDTATPPADTATPPADTATPPADTGPAPDTAPPGPLGGVGAACASGADCAGGTCLSLPGGYCTQAGCTAGACPAGSACFTFTDGSAYCLDTCAASSECREGEGYVCDADGTCWPGDATPPAGDSPVGGPCAAADDCADPGAICYPPVYQGEPTGFVGGYCVIPDCTAGSCPAGATCEVVFQGGGTGCVAACAATSECATGYACYEPGFCFPGCATSGCPAGYGCDAAAGHCVPACTPASCPAGKVCAASGLCEDPPCTAASCGAGLTCASNGKCVPDLGGGPGAGPGPACPDLPVRDCTGSVAYCGALLPFDPDLGPGYEDYPLNGETWDDQWRSFARRDLQMLIKWAAAYVACKAGAWTTGNGGLLGLGDMSEADGAIPGTSVGAPGHPEGTHEDGYDMDIGYFQINTPDNRLRPVCEHTFDGVEQYHCVADPHLLDLWRTTLLIGALLSSDRTRVIGVDGKVGPYVEEAMQVLCAQGWVPAAGCDKAYAIAYEEEQTGKGWFLHHLHHLHVSLWGVAGSAAEHGDPPCLVPSCEPFDPRAFAMGPSGLPALERLAPAP